MPRYAIVKVPLPDGDAPPTQGAIRRAMMGAHGINRNHPPFGEVIEVVEEEEPKVEASMSMSADVTAAPEVITEVIVGVVEPIAPPPPPPGKVKHGRGPGAGGPQ